MAPNSALNAGLLRFDATVFGQMLNVIFLLVNLVALLVALGERASVPPGGLQWLGTLDWPALAQQFWAITQAEQVDSLTVMAAWLCISLLWLSATAIDFFIRQRKGARTAALQMREDDDSDALGTNGRTSSRGQSHLAGESSFAAGQSGGSQALTGGAGFAGAMASAQAAQATGLGGTTRTANLADPTLGPLLNDLERQVSSLPAEAQQEIDQLRRALEALVAKP